MTTRQRQTKQTIIAIVYGTMTSVLVFFAVITLFPRVDSFVTVQEDTPQNVEVIDYNTIPLGNGRVDFWAKIRNPNDDWGAKTLPYTFELKNPEGIIEQKTGESFILPGDQNKYIVLLNYPQNYTLENVSVSNTINWTKLSKFTLPELIVRNVRVGVSDKIGNPFTVSGVLTNSSTVNLKNIQIISVIEDDNNQVIGVNETLVRDILRTESRDFELTWDSPIIGANSNNVTIYPQSNILDAREILIELQQGPVDGQ